MANVVTRATTLIIAIIAFLDGVVSLTATPCTVTMSGCGGTFSIFVLPTDFVVNMSDPIDPATLDASDFTVNGIPANNFYLIKRQHDDNLRLYDLACGAGRQHYAYRRRRF